MDRMTAQQYRAGARRGNKYGAKKVTTEEGVFDSKMEYERWCDLKLLEAAGEIAHLERQVPFELTVNGVRLGRFTADHRYFDVRGGEMIVEDVKGALAREVGLKLRLMKAIHGIDVQLWPERKRKKRGAKK